MLQKLDTDKINNVNRKIYHSKLFNSRGSSTSTTVVLIWKFSVLLKETLVK